jgi:ribosome-associated protein
MINITSTIVIDEKEIEETFIRASGPGGQNVNKTSSAVQLRFNAQTSPNLPEDVRERLIRLAGSRMTGEGVLIIHAQRFRTQERNRQDALDRLTDLIRQAAQKPKSRRRTRPSAASIRRRMDSKRQRSAAKKRRQPVSGEE